MANVKWKEKQQTLYTTW